MLICTVTARPPTAPCRPRSWSPGPMSMGCKRWRSPTTTPSKACRKPVRPAMSGACAGSAGWNCRAPGVARPSMCWAMTSRSTHRRCSPPSRPCTGAAGCAPKKSTSGWPAKACPVPSTAPGPCSKSWVTAAMPRHAHISPSSWCVPATSRTAVRRFANGWAPASWATSSSIGQPLRKPSRPCDSPTLG
ncbi:hypothetical protein D3C79_802210 [compost metagenome]